MARDHGRVFSAIWGNNDFTALGADAQRLYMLLLSQADLNFAGLISLRLRRWAAMAEHTTPADIESDLRELHAARFIVVDFDTEEVLIRTFVRNDGLWKSPNMFKAMVKDTREISSDVIKCELLAEIKKLPLVDLSDKTGAKGSRAPRDIAFECLAQLEKTLTERVTETPTETVTETPNLERVTERVTETPPARGSISTTPTTSPTPSTCPAPTRSPNPSDSTRLAELLAELMTANGCKPPTITTQWLTDLDRMHRIDNRSWADIEGAIRWAQADDFWRANIHSPHKLRTKFDQLRLQAGRPPPASPRQHAHNDLAAMQARLQAEEAAAERLEITG